MEVNITLLPGSFYHQSANKKMTIITPNESNNNHLDLKCTSYSQ